MTAPFENISIVLVRPQHSGNIGAIARSIANHGLGQLFLVDPPAFDPDRVRWMAPNAHHIINNAVISGTVKDAIKNAQLVIGASARHRSWKIPFIDLQEFCNHSSSPVKISLLFGPEDSGLSNEDIQYCHSMISLPTHEHKSLNLSQAVNVFGAHLMASATPSQNEPYQKPSMAIHHSVVEAAMRMLNKTSFLGGKNPLHVRNHLIQILGKSNSTHQDLVFLKSIYEKTFHSIRVLNEKIDSSDLS